MSFERFLQDFNIDHVTSGNKHCTAGWANIHCPFCSGSQNYHLGIHIETGICNCWRCGWKPTHKIIAVLLRVSEKRAKEITQQYRNQPSTRKTTKVKIYKRPLELPTGTSSLSSRHKQYLRRRGFDPHYLEKEWNLMSTGPISKLDGIDYKHRILIPIYWNGEMVSFQARDVTGKSNIKYKACPKRREKVSHQEILYTHPNNQANTGICVEGVTDVWRFGSQSVATFGINFTQRQLQALAKSFQRIAVVFDNDPQAIEQARKLVSELDFRNVEVWQMTITGDPGDMSQSEANELVEQIITTQNPTLTEWNGRLYNVEIET